MLRHEETRKLLLLFIVVCVVLGIFFFQNRNIATNSGPRPTPTPIVASSGNISVSVPFAESSVGPDFLVIGKARVFENVVSIRVSNKVLGEVYYTGTAMAQAPDAGQFGEFAAEIHLDTTDFSLRPNDKLTLEVFQASAKDGRDIDVVSIPLYFSPQLP